MLDHKKVKIGIAPIAWTEDDMPEMGAENSFLQTISEIALTGYVGTEIGCQFPRDPAILNKEFGRRLDQHLPERAADVAERTRFRRSHELPQVHRRDRHQHLGSVFLHPAPVEHPAVQQESAER